MADVFTPELTFGPAQSGIMTPTVPGSPYRTIQIVTSVALVVDSAGVTVNGKIITIAAGSFPVGWNNAVHSVSTFTGAQNFYLEFVHDAGGDYTVGFNTTPLVAGTYNSIPRGMVLSGGAAWIAYDGAPNAAGAAAVGNVVRMEHTAGGNIVWKVNGGTVWTSPTPWTGADTIYFDFDNFGAGVPTGITLNGFGTF